MLSSWMSQEERKPKPILYLAQKTRNLSTTNQNWQTNTKLNDTIVSLLNLIDSPKKSIRGYSK